MAAKVAITNHKGPAAKPYFSSAIQAGDTIYVSGNTGADPETGAFIPGTIKDRTRRTLKNIDLILNGAGASLKDIVTVTIYLSKYTEDFASFNEAYLEMFAGVSPMPARTCIGVAALPANTDVEITVTAVKSSSKL
ncbi:hypothetical protein MNV49_003122 [Pseudohyphozyma bogoriensis]|nr:hypothetical protein MNV49_003122 [Pseudohyphozyma bogoriensis]